MPPLNRSALALSGAAAGDDGRVRLLSYPCVVDDAPARCANNVASNSLSAQQRLDRAWHTASGCEVQQSSQSC